MIPLATLHFFCDRHFLVILLKQEINPYNKALSCFLFQRWQAGYTCRYISFSRAMRDAERSEASRIARLYDRNIGYSSLYAGCRPPCLTERTAFEKVVCVCVCVCAHFLPYMVCNTKYDNISKRRN